MSPARPARAAKDPELVSLGARLRTLRLKRGLTQESLAEAAELHWTYIGQIERGERNLTYKNLLRLSRGLQVGITDLVDVSGSTPTSTTPPGPSRR